jgi:replication initiation protein RepC
VDDCPQTTPPGWLACFGISGCFASESPAGFDRNHRLLCLGTRTFTRPQDWERGARPIVWPSAARQQAALGLSRTQVKALNRALIEASLITMKDSPNRKRYGRRDPQGRIIEAYGFDLSPLAVRYAEFAQLVAEARAERADMGWLRRRATIAGNGITQILETAAEYGCDGEAWTSLARDAARLQREARQAERLEAMAFVVEGLERRQRTARERLEELLAPARPVAPETVYTDPKGTQDRPHYTYKPTLDPEKDTVAGVGAGEVDRIGPGPRLAGAGKSHQPGDRTQSADGLSGQTDSGPAFRISVEEVSRLFPQLWAHVQSHRPDWPDLVDAAHRLSATLGISQGLWGEACRVLGRAPAAVAVAIVAAKPPAHFRTTPGGYFHAMVQRATRGDLRLERTLWGLRQQASRSRA